MQGITHTTRCRGQNACSSLCGTARLGHLKLLQLQQPSSTWGCLSFYMCLCCFCCCGCCFCFCCCSCCFCCFSITCTSLSHSLAFAHFLCVRVCVCVCAVVVICCCLQFLSPKSLSTTSLSHAALCNIIKQPRPWSILSALAHPLCPTRQANLNQLSNLIAASALPFAAVVCS